MIYDRVNEAEPIRQGDIFLGLPRVDLSLSEVVIVADHEERVATWAEISRLSMPVKAIVPIRPVAAIVASQNCDARTGRDITLCEISPFICVEHKANERTAVKGWMDILTQHARINQKWFYLPPDPQIGFTEKMAVDFRVTLRVPRMDLEGFRSARKGRLNSLAEEHFRERIAEFFRRYAYDEWYPLSVEELAKYRIDYPEATPFPWQATAEQNLDRGR